MATKAQLLAVALVAFCRYGLNEAIKVQAAAEAEAEAAAAVYRREERRHRLALAQGLQNMTIPRAIAVLKDQPGTPKELLTIVHKRLGQEYHAHTVHHHRAHLRMHGRVQRAEDPDPEALPQKAAEVYGADVIKAKDLLNQMIYEIQTQYEVENKKCCDYEHTKRGLIEEVAQDIALFNAEAAQGRALILSAQSQINLAEGQIPALSDALTLHSNKCNSNIDALKTELATVMSDKVTMTSLATITDCKKDATFVQVGVLQCLHPCTQEPHMLFSSRALRSATRELRSPFARRLMHEGLEKVHAKTRHSHLVSSFLQEEVDDEMVAEYNAAPDPTTPRMVRPNGPCEKPASTDLKSTNCRIGAGSCEILQERLQVIYAAVLDKNNELQDAVQRMERNCKAVRTSYESQISDLTTLLSSEQAKLAAATKTQNNADEQSRLKTVEKKDLEGEFGTMTGTCQKNYQQFEDQLCGLTKLRGELFKVKAPGASFIMEDCKLAAWSASPCSRTCGGGAQTLTRSILVAPSGGVKCLPLTQVQECNSIKCPVDCQLEDWQRWSGCTSECGGGVQQRARLMSVRPRYGGKPCGETGEVRSCNLQSCNADCVLSEWSSWSECSKGCDSGRQRRIRMVSALARGTGRCPNEKNDDRLQYRSCNSQRCPSPLGCQNKLDVVLLLDGSSRVGADGFEASKVAAQQLVRAIAGTGVAQVGLILFSGPQTLSGLRLCTNEDTSRTPDMAKDCSIRVVSRLTLNHFDLSSRIRELSWPQGSALTSAALATAEAELQNGRKDANSVVIVITRGQPLSIDKTTTAASALMKKARLMWVPVIGSEPLQNFRQWSSDPDDENIMPIANFNDLKTLATTDYIVASTCPTVSQQDFPPLPQHEWDFRECLGNVKDTYGTSLARLTGGTCGAQGVYLNGNKQFVTYDPFFFGGSIAIEASVKFEDFQEWSRIFDCGFGPNDNDILLANMGAGAGAQLEVNTAGAPKQYLSVSDFFVKNAWVHLIATLNEGTARLYRNGVLVGTRKGLTGPQVAMRPKCWTGKSNYAADRDLKGTVAYLRTWQGFALSDSQVQNMYAQEASRYSYFVVYDGNVVMKTSSLKEAKQRLNSYSQANAPPERMICELVDGVVTMDRQFLGPDREVQERPGLFVTLFVDCDFRGGSATLRPGAYDMNQMGFPDNALSSIRVPPGLAVTLYEHPNYQGTQLTLTGDTSCLIGRNFNDVVSGIRIQETGLAVNKWWANDDSATKMLKTCAAEAVKQVKDCELNPPEGSRSYSSVFDGNPLGSMHARSKLNSPQAWSAQVNKPGQWMQMDLGEVREITGVVVQGRADADQRVTKFNVQCSVDNKEFTVVPGPFDCPAGVAPDAVVRRFFPEPVTARYVRIVVQEWVNHISMRAGVSVCKAR